jgi:hypothetical protein
MNYSIASMKTFLPCLSVAILAGSLSGLSAGDITGKVDLKGTPKPEMKIDLGPSCGPVHPNKDNVTTRHYVVGSGGGLANVFVYLKDAKPTPAKGPGPVLDQMGCMYEPFVFGVVVNQPFKIRNSDPLLHNIHATPKLNKEFNFGQPVKGQETDKSFDQAEILVRIKCDVHPWMLAYAGVCEHPYFAITDKDGNFKIADVPDGKYTIVAYHLKTHGATNPGLIKPIEVKGSVKQDFTVELQP